MPKIKVMCDSPADVPAQLVEQYQIKVVPVELFIGDDTYHDGQDITSHEFFARQKALPENESITHAQIKVLDFYDAFQEVEKQGYDTLLCFTMSPNTSGTHQNAHMAKKMMDDENTKLDIRVLDGKSLTYVYGRFVVEAAKMAMEGKSVDEILERVLWMQEHHFVVFTVGTLKYLKKGGRLHPAAAAIGEVLGIKPLLSVNDGLVTSLEKVRGSKKVNQRILALLKENGAQSAKEFYVLDGDVPEKAAQLEQMVKDEFHPENLYRAYVGPVIGVHTGEDITGVIIYQ